VEVIIESKTVLSNAKSLDMIREELSRHGDSEEQEKVYRIIILSKICYNALY